MAIDQTAIPKDLRPLNLSRAAAPGATTPLPPASDLLLSRGNSSPRSRPHYYTVTTTAAVDHLAGFPTGGLPTPPLAPWPTVVYPQQQQLLPNGFAELRVVSNAAAGSAAASNDAPDEPQRSSSSTSSRKVKFLCSFGGKILPRPSDGALRYVGGHTRIIALRRDASFQELKQKMSETYGGPAVLKYQLPDEDLDALVTVSCPEDLENMMEEYDKLAEDSAEGSAKLRVFLFSPTELDFNLASDGNDTGQSYVDAVNGLTDKEWAGIKRRESAASLSSTQTSDGVPVELLESTTGGTPSAIPAPSVAVPASAASEESIESGYPDALSNPIFSLSATTAVPVNVTSCAGIPSLQNLPSTRLEQPLPASAGATYMTSASIEPLQDGFNRVDYVHDPSQIQFLNLQQLGAPVGFVAAPQHSYLPAVHMTVAMPAAQVSSGKPVPARVENYLDDGSSGGRTVQIVGNPTYKPVQALSQLPPLPSSLLQPQNIERYGLCQVQPPGLQPVQALRYEDCGLCQRALPHAHSDTLMQEHGGSITNKSPAFYSLHSEGMARSHFPLRVGDGPMQETASVHQLEGGMAPPHLGTHRYSQAAESQHVIEATPHGAENFGNNKFFHPQVLGFSSVVQAPYGVYLSNHTSAWHEGILQQQQQQQPPIPSPQYLFKPDPLINNAVGTNIASARNATSQNSEPSIQDPLAEFSYDHTQHVDGMMEASHLTHSQATGLNERQMPAAESNPGDSAFIEEPMEALHISPSEISGIVEPWKAVTKTNFSAHDELNPESSPWVLEATVNTKPSIIETDIFSAEASLSPGKVAETNSFKLVDLLPSSALEATVLHNVQPGDSNQVSSVLGNLEPRSRDPELGCVPPIPHERLLQGPNATKVSVSDWKDEVSQLYSGNALNDLYAPSGGMVPFSLSSMNTQNMHFGDGREPAASESFFSNMEPWQIMHNTHSPPPKPRRVASRDMLVPRDSYVEKLSGNSGESGTAAQLGEVSNRQPLDSLVKNADLNTSVTHHMEGAVEELIKQELQAVAEGVAASVLQQCIPVPGHTGSGNTSFSETSKDREVHEDNVDSQSSALLVDHRAVDIQIGQLDKTNLGFPIFEDLGRLQIIKNSDLEELRELGSGTFGTVYHGKWRGSDVAIKRINDRCFAGKQSEQERLRTDFWNEACKLADLHHPNVVAFYGVVLDGPGGTVATVTEYMVNGSLRQALQRNHKTLDRRKRLLIAMDVAFGMEYLHGKNIVHFDLKSDNLLVNLRDPQRPICKVGDLGLSKVKCQTLISGGVRGTLPWMAPELLNGSSSLVSEKVDVFSFGIVLWELLTGEEPYADLHYGAIIGGIVSNTLRPPIPETCDPEWRSLMEKCWSSEPSERPSFTEIANTLRSMTASAPQKGQVQAQTSGSVQPQK